MKRVSFCVATIAVVIIGAAAGQSGSPERPRSTGERDLPPEALPAKSEPRPADAESSLWGRFQGRVIFNGKLPEPRIIADPEERIAPRNHRGQFIDNAPLRRLPDYEVMAKRGAPIWSERFLVDPETKGVRFALVYLVRPTAVRELARCAAPITLQFRADRGVFVPHVLAAMEGAELLISTNDPTVYDLHARLPGTEFLVEESDSRSEKSRVQSHRDQVNSLFGNFLRNEAPRVVDSPAPGRETETVASY